MENKMTSLELDTLSRNRIVSETDKNFFVEAGAGSGKTTMLVSRMVAMVEAGIDISKVCAITFTKAAANEFYDRFQKLLIERSNPDYVWVDKGYAGQLPKPTELTRERCLNALQNIDLCFMGTIDSFCGMVLSEHPSDAGIPSDSVIMSDDDALVMYKQAYVKINAGEFGTNLAALARTFRALHSNAEEVFVAGMDLFMNHRNAEFVFNSNNCTDIDRSFAAERTSLIASLEFLLDHEELLYTNYKKSIDAWDNLFDAYKTIRRKWSNNFSSVCYAINSLKELRLIPEALDKYPFELADNFEPGGAQKKWLDFKPAKPGELYTKLNELQYEVSVTFFDACVKELEKITRDKGKLSYFDYLFYLRNMLREDAKADGKLIRYIYDRHSYFLIDEFQDTNPMQAEVFFYLSSENPVEQWTKCVPRDGSLFIVGDPKQSIYRFRSADVASFMKVKNLFKQNGGEILLLSRNFRSTKMMCSYYNRIFSSLLSVETANQSKFEEIPLPENDSTDFQGVYKYKAYTGKSVALYPDQDDRNMVNKIIARIVDNEKYKITPEGETQARRIKYSDIMVITFGKKALEPIMTILNDSGIPTKVEGGVPFKESQALWAIYSLYAAACDDGNETAVYNALLGKVYNFSDRDILEYKKAGGTLCLRNDFDNEGCTDGTVLEVAKAIEDIKKLSALSKGLSPAALFTKILDGGKLFKYVNADHLEVLYYSLELIRNAEKSGLIVTHEDARDYIAKLLEGSSEEERCLSLDDKKDCVHMANLHKVKGLEAPVVILAASAEKRNISPSSRFENDNNETKGYVFAVEGERYATGAPNVLFGTTIYEDKAEAEKEALKAENSRLIYVAATRARNALIICDNVYISRGSEVRNSMWKPLMESGTRTFFDYDADASSGISVPAVKSEPEKVSADDLYCQAEESCVLNSRTVEQKTYEVKTPSHVKEPSKLDDENMTAVTSASNDLDEESSQSAENAHRFPALLGTMTHRLMEILVSTKNKAKAEDAVAEIIHDYSTPGNKAFEKDLSKVLLDVADKIRNGGYEQTNGAPKDILKELLLAEECYCEVPFAYKEETDGEVVLWNGIMDVIYLKDGIWHIIDYKTNLDGADLDEKYKAQLNAYKKAFKATTGEDAADALTYHIDI